MDVRPLERRLRHPWRETVQAVLYPNDGQGFALYARQGRTLHAVTYEGRSAIQRMK